MIKLCYNSVVDGNPVYNTILICVEELVMSVRKKFMLYKEKVLNDLVEVDNAISDGMYLTREEWVDFICKSAMVGRRYRSWNIFKYKIFNKSIAKFAECMAETLTYVVDIACNGFDNESFAATVAYLVSEMNTLLRYESRVFIDTYDKNGSYYVSVRVGSSEKKVYKVASVRDAIERVKEIFRCCINNIDSFSHDGDFGIFINGYISREFSVIVRGELPTPYVCEDCSYCTLKEYIKKEATYNQESMRTAMSTSYTGGKLIKIS